MKTIDKLGVSRLLAKILVDISEASQQRILAMLSLLFLIANPLSVQGLEAREMSADSLKTMATELMAGNQGVEGYFQKAPDVKQWIQGLQCRNETTQNPSPPQLPRNFSWKGRYIVSDLVDPETGQMGINVPFTWHGKDGNIQMIAGSKKHPIYFTNLIYNNHLYTYTYKWPDLQPEFLPPLERCVPLLEFSLEDLNAFLATSRYVEPEILEGKSNRHVHHFRVGVVFPNFFPSGFYPRLPIALADIYVDQKNPSKFWQVLHFGLQNIYDPALDEWIVINKMSNRPGKIKLPAACSCSQCSD